jgi:hypothetical protein
MTSEKTSPPWVLFVFLGCGAMITIVVAFVAFVVVIALGVMRTTTPYKEGVARAQRDPRVIAALGSPVKPAYFFRGEINTEEREGKADFTVTLRGPKGRGRLHVSAKRINGYWRYSRMDVSTHGQRIDLLERISP